MNKNSEMELKEGIIASLLAALIWGIMPIFWKLLNPIDSFTIILFRILFCSIFAFLLCIRKESVKVVLGRLIDFEFIKVPFTAGIIITFNWSLYIWAVSNDRIVETSLGYYIEPLIICVLGLIIFKEKLTVFKTIAICFAIAGTMVAVLYFQSKPVIPLALAITFATYAVVKKKYTISSIQSLFYETAYLVPIVVILIIYREYNGLGISGNGYTYQIPLLPLAGILTLIPLAIYGFAAPRIPLITLGLTGYLAPTLALLIGVLIYNEPFELIQFIAFGIIWLGLMIFTIGQYKELNGNEIERAKK